MSIGDIELKTLLDKIQKGDETACRLFFNEYKTMVANICYKFLGPNMDVSEMVQKAFIDIFAALPGYRGDSELKTWIYRICANHCFKEIRIRGVQNKYFVKDETAAANVADATLSGNPEACLTAKERRRIIENAVQSLDPEKRMVLLLHDVENCTMQQIADIVKVAIGTVKSRLFHARREMRSKLNRVAESL